MSIQREQHRQSLLDPQTFWAKQAKQIVFTKSPSQVYSEHKDLPYPHYRWFDGAELNTCFNCLDVHLLSGFQNANALFFDSPLTNTKTKFTYREVFLKVNHIAFLLSSTVLIYMPMIPEAVFAMLAIARLGAIHSVVFGGFAPKELAKRIDDCKPSVILTASAGVQSKGLIPFKPLVDQAIALSVYKPTNIVLFQRRDLLYVNGLDAARGELDWEVETGKIENEYGQVDWEIEVGKKDGKKNGSFVECVSVKGEDPLYLLYTSGSTGIPKGVVRDNVGHAVQLKYVHEHVFGINPGDVFFCASDIGWVVGHSFIVYANFLQRSTTVLYEGKPVGTPDAGQFWRIVQEYKVNCIFTAPTALRAIKKEDPTGKFVSKYDIKSLRSLFVAGERCDPDTVSHFNRLLNVPIRDNYWQTEVCAPIIASFQHPKSHSMSTNPKIGAAGLPCPGYDIQIFIPPKIDENEEELGAFYTLWNNHNGYLKSYMSTKKGYYDLTDAGMIDKEGFVTIMARTDDVFNVSGHRLSTGGIEQSLSSHPDVAECAVVAINDKLTGSKPIAFIVLKTNATRNEYFIGKELFLLVRNEIEAIASSLKHITFAQRLPKTITGKILRRTLRSIGNFEKYEVPATIESEDVLLEIEEIYAKTTAGKNAKI